MSAALKLPGIRNQTAFNLDRWDELAHDEQVRQWPGRVETDRFGRTIMYHYAEYSHGGRQFEIASILSRNMPEGKTTVECPISTREGIRVADVSWVSSKRLLKIGGRKALKGAPEICVEVVSPSNTKGEIEEKRRLYFEAGAHEVWICDLKGRLFFYLAGTPGKAAPKSALCPDMPKVI